MIIRNQYRNIFGLIILNVIEQNFNSLLIFKHSSCSDSVQLRDFLRSNPNRYTFDKYILLEVHCCIVQKNLLNVYFCMLLISNEKKSYKLLH